MHGPKTIVSGNLKSALRALVRSALFQRTWIPKTLDRKSTGLERARKVFVNN